MSDKQKYYENLDRAMTELHDVLIERFGYAKRILEGRFCDVPDSTRAILLDRMELLMFVCNRLENALYYHEDA